MNMRWTTTFLAPWLLLAAAESRGGDFGPVACEGTYPNHLQGVCTDGENSIFWSFTTKLVKTDRDGKVVRMVDADDHHGDLCFVDGKVHVAVNLGKFNDPKGNADSWVYVYDAEDLALVAKHKTAEVFHGAGGIAHHDGKFMVVGGLPDDVKENYVHEYDGDFQSVKKHVLASGHTHLGIQTAAFADGHWWFGCYGRPKSNAAPATPPILLKADATLGHVERFEFDASLGMAPLGEGRFLVARGAFKKEKGHAGRLVSAVADDSRGMRFIEAAASPN
jgi:hypothetical protein